jgi:hypothetical protein
MRGSIIALLLPSDFTAEEDGYFRACWEAHLVSLEEERRI